MTRSDLASAIVAQTSGVSAKDAEAVLAALPKVMHGELTSTGMFQIHGLGSFHVHDVAARPERPGRNPKTGEPITITAKPASKRIGFRAGKALVSGL